LRITLTSQTPPSLSFLFFCAGTPTFPKIDLTSNEEFEEWRKTRKIVPLDSSSTSEDLSVDKTVGRLGKPGFSFLSATYDKSSIETVYPSIPTSVKDTNFLLAGKIKKTKSNFISIQLNYGFGTKITHQVQYELFASTELETGLVPRFWAQRYIDELKLFPEIPGNDDKILQIGRKFSIVTPNTSLIVLEKLDQYLQYDIEPPVTLPVIHEQWIAIMNERKHETHMKKEEKINDVLSLWKRRVAWWNEDVACSETAESYIIHCAEFGKGIDFVSKKLGLDWINFNKVVESNRELNELKAFRELEQKGILQMQREWARIEEENRKKIELEKKAKLEEERKKRAEKELREKMAQKAFEEMLSFEDASKKEKEMKKKIGRRTKKKTRTKRL